MEYDEYHERVTLSDLINIVQVAAIALIPPVILWNMTKLSYNWKKKLYSSSISDYRYLQGTSGGL